MIRSCGQIQKNHVKQAYATINPFSYPHGKMTKVHFTTIRFFTYLIYNKVSESKEYQVHGKEIYSR